MKGFVKTWITQRGFGFISPDEAGRDIFIHFRDIAGPPGLRSLNPGERVEFDLVESERGPKAENCRLVT